MLLPHFSSYTPEFVFEDGSKCFLGVFIHHVLPSAFPLFSRVLRMSEYILHPSCHFCSIRLHQPMSRKCTLLDFTLLFTSHSIATNPCMGTRNAFASLMNVSAPPYPVVITGTPQLIASCATRPHPSPRVGSTTAVAYVSLRAESYKVVEVGEIGFRSIFCEDEVVREL